MLWRFNLDAFEIIKWIFNDAMGRIWDVQEGFLSRIILSFYKKRSELKLVTFSEATSKSDGTAFAVARWDPTYGKAYWYNLQRMIDP